MNILDFLFPKKCVGCNKVGNYFCSICISNIKQTDLVCPFCERPSFGGVVHPVCKRRYGLDGLWSLGIYEKPLKTAISKLKYKWVSELAETLINITIEYWARYQPIMLDQIKKNRGEDWIVVPVPLHWQRQNWRGFNQASLLASILARKLGLKNVEALKRISPTHPQVGQEAYKRRQNVKGAFALDSRFQSPATNILLIDDVWTTGSTLKECCYVIKRGDAKQVWALTIAS